MQYLVISSSLDPASRSRILAGHGRDRLRARGAETAWLDTAEVRPPLCDAATAWEHAGTHSIRGAIEHADGVLLGLGVYNYAASAVAKTLLELGGSAWNDTVVAAVCTASGPSSYMAAMGLLNSLMLDFRCVVVPRFVFATADAFDGDRLADADVRSRLDAVAADLMRMTEALGSRRSEAPPPPVITTRVVS